MKKLIASIFLLIAFSGSSQVFTPFWGTNGNEAKPTDWIGTRNSTNLIFKTNNFEVANWNNSNLTFLRPIKASFEQLSYGLMNAYPSPQIGQNIFNTYTKTNWFFDGTTWVNAYTAPYITTAPPPFIVSDGELMLPYSSTTADGYLRKIDFSAFNNKIGSAANGLQTVATQVQLGGTLTKNVDFAGNFNLTTSGTGNLGLGVLTPIEKLEVNGKVKATNLQATAASIASSASPFYYAVFDANGNVLKEPIIVTLSPALDNTITTPPTAPSVDDAYLIPTGSTVLWVGQTNKIATWSGSDWVYYTPVLNNKISILTGTNVGSIYTYDGTNWVVTPVLASNNFTLDGNNVTSIKKLGTISNFDLPVITNNIERLRVTSTGNVGIGTTAPTQKLEIVGSTDGSAVGPLNIVNSGGTIGTALSIDSRPVGGKSWSFISTGPGASAPAGSFAFYQAGSGYMMTLSQAGNVGIGTTTPTSKLEVAGQVKITGGTPALGRVLTSDATGLASWAVPATNGTVTTVTATAPLSVLTPTTTPSISIATANSTTTGALINTDWNTFNAKQEALISGTNIKTINSTSVVGSGNIAVEPTVIAGTTAQYYRGDKTWQTLDKTAVGLSNSDNTTDLNKPISTATQMALNAKLATANNGLTATGTLVELGGTLTKNTNIAGNFNLTTSGTANVGLGTTTPTAKLDVRNSTIIGSTAGSTVSIARFQNQIANASVIDFTTIRHTAGVDWKGTNIRLQRTIDVTKQGFIDFGIDGQDSNTGLGFGSNSITNMVLTSGGNLGIGTTAPTAKLEINNATAGSGLKFTQLNSSSTPVTGAATLGVDATGNVVVKPSGIFMSVSGGLGQVIGASFNTIIMNTVVSAVGVASSNYNTTTGIYTVPVTGTYQITANLRFADSQVANTQFGLGVNIANDDGAWMSWSNINQTTSGSNRTSFPYIRVVNLTAGAQLRMYSLVDTGSMPINIASMQVLLLF